MSDAGHMSERDNLSGRLELLAPAGDWECMQAAIEAGADAVYCGLRTLNARRRAKNFTADELVRAVEAAHARGVRVYLTLNTDLSERDLGQAARILELARRCGVDAVLVRDAAVLALKPYYPQVPLHFSTQTCMANSADVAAAGSLGAARVVLAREMSLGEIAAASASGVQTEVFAQGALCFCISGRCLLSSWVGGRSANRGMCTSPCRVPWTIDNRQSGTPLSMRDLAAVERLQEIAAAGVTALKIEGRLKNSAWVRQAVALYRQALSGGDLQLLRKEADRLGDYSGREMTCAYLDGQRDRLTGTFGRPAAETTAGGQQHALPNQPQQQDAQDQQQQPQQQQPEQLQQLQQQQHPQQIEQPHAAATKLDTYDLEVEVGPRNITVRCTCGGQTAEWPVTKSVVHRPHKAVSIAQLFERLQAQTIEGHRPGKLSSGHTDFLLVPRAANALVDRIAAAIRQSRKGADQTVRIDLPDEVRAVLEKTDRAEANRKHLGDPPTRARLEAGMVAKFLRNVQPSGVIVEGLSAGRLGPILEACNGVPLTVALPQVFFEDEIGNIQRLLRECKAARLSVEVNSWGGWRLAKQAGVRMESGPGLPVLNSLAARVMMEHGIRSVTLSLEADRRQLEELTAHCPVPCSLVVFGRPPLMITRVGLPDEAEGRVFEDRRGVRITPRRERGLWVFRPVEPFDLRGCTNQRIRVQHLVVDLVGSPDPVGEWFDVPLPHFRTFRFNYDRTLS